MQKKYSATPSWLTGNIEITKILKVDYPRGSATEYYANSISAQKLKIEFSLFYPSINRQLPVDVSPEN